MTELNTVFEGCAMMLTVKTKLVYYVKQDQDNFDQQHKYWVKDHCTDTEAVTNQSCLSVNLPCSARPLSLVSTSSSVVSSLTTLTCHSTTLIFSLPSHPTSQPIINLINWLSQMIT